jgi:hypothetical protein
MVVDAVEEEGMVLKIGRRCWGWVGTEVPSGSADTTGRRAG